MLGKHPAIATFVFALWLLPDGFSGSEFSVTHQHVEGPIGYVKFDPIASFHCSVTRELPDGSIFQPEQRLTRDQALRSYTINNAFAAFEENIKGSITPDKLADITVLSKDIMSVSEDEILETEIIYTILGGKIVYKGTI